MSRTYQPTNRMPFSTEKLIHFRNVPISGYFRKPYSTKTYLKINEKEGIEIIKDNLGNPCRVNSKVTYEPLKKMDVWIILPSPFSTLSEIGVGEEYIDIQSGEVKVKTDQNTSEVSDKNFVLKVIKEVEEVFEEEEEVM